MDFKKAINYWLLVAVWMVVIFQFSDKPAQRSDTQSLFIIKQINIIANNLGFKGELLNNDWNYFVRKAAHTCEYAMLGILLFLAFSSTGIVNKKLLVYTILICVIYAVTDEIHQAFVPGRAAKVTDVLIDTFGSLIGIGLIKVFGFLNGTMKE